MNVRHVREWNGRCMDCAAENRDGADLPVCRKAEPAGEPYERLCAWCGHGLAL